jgi:putative transcriptional regulator
MQNLKQGQVLVATTQLHNDYFAGARIYLAEVNAAGVTGFILNRPFNRKLNELEEFLEAPAIPIYEGGPVDQEHLYLLHRCSGLVEGGAPAGNGLYYGGNFLQVIQHLQSGRLSAGEIRLFTGYCGWDAGEVEEEIKEGSWRVEEGNGWD